MALVTKLQEARETKNAIMKELQGRLYAKFDENYKDWLKAVKIIAELDCLCSLSKSSSALGCKSPLICAITYTICTRKRCLM